MLSVYIPVVLLKFAPVLADDKELVLGYIALLLLYFHSLDCLPNTLSQPLILCSLIDQLSAHRYPLFRKLLVFLL